MFGTTIPKDSTTADKVCTFLKSHIFQKQLEKSLTPGTSIDLSFAHAQNLKMWQYSNVPVSRQAAEAFPYAQDPSPSHNDLSPFGAKSGAEFKKQ
ncbi:hypothetical protein BHYA_0207g00070 [Botrytis hyacinthi]|uniref:Uncharacterized protein n=1 Tax=Botrytis hyacinthi TaxID=278943 RepID=A0A4Z1GGA9_9HELO|nr:hypothetical protein BHYA_0207g00070 [Botrytis hyacinthi]